MKKSLFGLVLAVACSTVLAGPPSDPSLSTDGRDVALWNTGLSLVPGNCTNLLESTGFEAVDGWEDLWQICGSTFAGCVQPVANVAACTLPGPDENCCLDYPNPYNCWATSSASRSCEQPSIRATNAFAGTQHLHFEADLSTGGSHQCFTPLQNLSTPGNTHIEFMLFGSPGAGAGLNFRAFDDTGGAPSGTFATYMFFDSTGGTNNIYINDYNKPAATRKTFVGYWTPGVYKKMEIDINPCRETGFITTYKYGGVQIYSHSSTAFVALVERANWLFTPNSGTKTWDVDNYIITRGAFCAPAVCGDGFVDAPENCEPSVPGACPEGRCIAPGLPGACTCQRICTLNDPCMLENGANGPFIGPFDASYGGIFLYFADAQSTSINTCGSTGDTYIRWWGSAMDPMDPGNANDDCCDPMNPGCGTYGEGSDPSASCYLPGDNPPYPACTCWSLTQWPIDNLFLAQITGSTTNLMVEITKAGLCGEPIPGGACCDGETGFCVDGAAMNQAACDAIDAQGVFTGQTTYLPNKSCAIMPCARHTGACCDGTPKAEDCTQTFPEDCVGPNRLWVKGATCQDVPYVCPAVVLGACCNVRSGICLDNKVASECLAEWDVFKLDQTCANTTCVEVTGACCDHDTFGLCTYTTYANCQGPKDEWFKGMLCEDTCTQHDAIPTVSQWGLVVLTLLLLVGAKVYFGRRQNATA